MSGPPAPILLSPPSVGPIERAAILRAFDSGWVAPLGPDVDAFEAELGVATSAESVVALSSGTAALHLALQLAGVGPGDDVLVQSLTFAATSNATHYIGARPVFVDSDPGTWTIDVDLVADYLESCRGAGRTLPKALIAVDIFGQCADYDGLLAACSSHDVAVIEDGAEALGATYKGRKAGALTDLGVLSFNGNKIITTSGGGALTARRPDDAVRAKHLATQAREPAAHYEHVEVGYNYRLSNLLAGLGRAQLSRLDEFVSRRRAIRERYRTVLTTRPGLDLMPEAPYGESNAWLSIITVDPQASGTTNDELRLELAAHHIESRPIWKPMHLQPMHAGLPFLGTGVVDGLFATGLCLPSGAGLTDAEQDRVIDVILAKLPAVA